jgi:hypothetical protein
MISIDLNDQRVTALPKQGAFLPSLDVSMDGLAPSKFSLWTGEQWVVFREIKMLRNGRSFYRSNCGTMTATI